MKSHHNFKTFLPTLHTYTLYKVYSWLHIEKHVGTELYVSSSYKLRGSCNVSGSWLTEFGMCTIRVCTQMYFANHAYTQGICNVNVFYSVN